MCLVVCVELVELFAISHRDWVDDIKFSEEVNGAIYRDTVYLSEACDNVIGRKK